MIQKLTVMVSWGEGERKEEGKEEKEKEKERERERERKNYPFKHRRWHIFDPNFYLKFKKKGLIFLFIVPFPF